MQLNEVINKDDYKISEVTSYDGTINVILKNLGVAPVEC